MSPAAVLLKDTAQLRKKRGAYFTPPEICAISNFMGGSRGDRHGVRTVMRRSGIPAARGCPPQ